MVDKYTIDSPYKALYWSFYNIAYSEIYKTVPEFIPTVPFEPQALSKLDGYPYVSTASARKILDLKETVAAVPPSYDYRKLLAHFETIVEHFRVSSTSFVVTEENYTYLKPSNYPYQLSYSLVVLWFAIYLDVIVGDFHLSVKGLSSELAESSILYYFKLFEYLPIDYDLSAKDIDTINSQLYVEMARFHGYMNKEVLPISEKQKLFKKQGYQEGSLVFLYEKGYVANEEVRSSKGTNKFINKVHLAKITKVTDTEVQFHTYNFYKTREGLLEDFESLPESIQELYGSYIEFLEPSLTVSRVEVGWDTSVPITVLNENLHFETTVLPIEVATLFLLLSYGVSFDEELYQNQYSVEVSHIRERVSFYTSQLEEKLGYEIQDFCKVKEIY